jgi:Tol biopolymer transport system component
MILLRSWFGPTPRVTSWDESGSVDSGRRPSPDDRFVAVCSDELHDGRWRICIHDLERGVTTRLTDGGGDWHPSWSPDNKRILYDCTEGHASYTYETAADGSVPRQLMLERGSVIAHQSAGGAIAFMQFDRGRPMVSVYTPE